MVTKFRYYIENSKVVRKPEYSFTAYEDLQQRLNEIESVDVANNVVATTLKGEAERDIIGVEDRWFKIQTRIQNMDDERAKLEKKLVNGDDNGNPLTAEQQKSIKAKIADLKEGTVVVEKEFYDHYTRKTYKVKETIQTSYTKAIEERKDLESDYPFLASYRGVATDAKRPEPKIDANKEKEIKKLLVRQEIGQKVGDDKDLIADMSKALMTLVKQVNGQAVSEDEKYNVDKFIERQNQIKSILDKGYIKK